MLARSWDTPAMPGERAAAAGDQDALTLGLEAALEATAKTGTDDIDVIIFATTTPPYAEKHAAATIATALGRMEARTQDVTGSLRAGTQALRAGLDAVRAGARAALVVAADVRPAEPGSAMEQLFGDGAGAVVLAAEGAAEVLGEASLVDEFAGPWRRTGDPHVRTFDAKIEVDRYVANTAAALEQAIKRANLTPDDINLVAGFAPDPRSFSIALKQAGLKAHPEPLIPVVGNLGAAHALVALAHGLDGAMENEHIACVAAAEGADAIVIKAGPHTQAARPAWSTARAVAHRRVLPSYERYLRFRRLLAWDDPDTPASTIRTWRDREQAFRLIGVRCTACETVQFPANRGCVACSTMDQMEKVALARAGSVFTFTLDHLIAGEYLETPVPRAVVDLDGGGRIFVEVTDCEPDEVGVGMRVELTFRLLHEGADFKNYYWKARPVRDAGHQG